MSTRFFASVRRNQKQWMVVVTVLSMVSFLFLDDFGKGSGPMSPMAGGLLIGCLCAAGLCIIGYPRGLAAEYGCGGFIAGFLAGFLGFGAVGANKPVARTAFGNFSRKDLNLVADQRSKANAFVFSVARKVQSQVNGFGGRDDQSILTYQMLLADAKKMGIQISDARVNQFLKDISKGELTKQDFKTCLREAHVGEGELFELLKSELAVQLVAELTQPPAYNAPIQPGFERFIQESPRYLQPTPHQLWETFQKLTVKESLQAVAVPVQEFTAKVGEPTDTEIAAFHQIYKTQRWIDESQPGFALLPRVQLAYLTADFEKFEKGADPTDQEVTEFYEKNRDRYRILPGTDSTKPKAPFVDGEPAKEEAPKTEAAPSDAASAKEPANEPKPAPVADSDVKKPTEPESKPEEAKKDAPKAEEEKPKSEEEKKSDCDETGAAEVKKETPEAPAAEVKAEAEAKKEEKKDPATETPASTESPKDAPSPKPEVADGDKPASDAPSPDSLIPKLNDAAESLPAPKFRELDDELKLEIREVILKERAFDRISAELDKAFELMIKLGLDYDTTDAKQKPEKAKAVADQLKEYAKAHNLEYQETAPLTYEELSAESIGRSSEGKGRVPVANEMFMQAGRESRVSLYSPRRSNSPVKTDAFAYWKTAEFPAQASDLKDETVRARVIAAWKFDQARTLAEKRAKEMLEKVKSQKNDLPAALTGETVNGDKDAAAVKVIPTEEFTWLSRSRSEPGASQNPTISTIPLIDNIGERFMKTVFEDLNDGDVGIVVDETRSVFYVVKVLNRSTAKEDDGGVAKAERHQEFMKEEFASRLFPLLKSPYQAIAQMEQFQIDQAWRRNFQQQHSVDMEKDNSPASDD